MTMLELTSDQYHADPCPTGPSLSSTTARTLLQRTPAHAKAEHPRLTDQPVRKDSAAMDMGTAVHQLLLRDDRVDVVPHDEWRTKEVKELVASIRDAGRIPMKPKTWQQAQDVAAAVREQIPNLNVKPLPFTDGKPEQPIMWKDNGADCRALIDWLRDDHLFIDDLKCTGKSANPWKWKRDLFNIGYDVQAAFYVRGIEAKYGVTPVFRWVVVETSAPYAVSVLKLSDEAMAAARVKVDTAISIWNTCLSTNEWPAYDLDVFVVDQPGWERQRQKDAWAELDVDYGDVPF